MRKNLTRISLISLFILLTTYQTNVQKIEKRKIFTIKKIVFLNNSILKKEDLLNKLDFLFNKNLLFADKKKIIRSLSEFDLISSAKIKKIYPSKLRITIQEKQIIALIFKDNKKFYMSEDGNLIKYFSAEYYNGLPNIFGNADQFYAFYNSLIKANFDISEIDSYYYFESNRWDVLMKNKDLIKLPGLNYQQSMTNYKKIKDDLKFVNYKIFDYRIADQLILK